MMKNAKQISLPFLTVGSPLSAVAFFNRTLTRAITCSTLNLKDRCPTLSRVRVVAYYPPGGP